MSASRGSAGIAPGRVTVTEAAPTAKPQAGHAAWAKPIAISIGAGCDKINPQFAEPANSEFHSEQLEVIASGQGRDATS